MKIAFFGTSDRSTPILESLKNDFDLALCITKTDSRVGRKQELKETGVKNWAKENCVEYMEINSAKKDAKKIVQKIVEKKIQLGVAADFGFIIPKNLIDTFPKGVINVHFSMLPKYRGASPVQFSILNGDNSTGITYYLLDEELDTGCIIEQFEYKIGENETTDELYDRLFEISGNEISKVIQNYVSGKTVPYPQNNSKATFTYSRTYPTKTVVFKNDAKIDWNDSQEKIGRVIRAYCPWPVAWTNLKELSENLNLTLKNEKNQNLLVKIHKAHVKNQRLVIDQIQVEGKNVMNWKDFENGYFS